MGSLGDDLGRSQQDGRTADRVLTYVGCLFGLLGVYIAFFSSSILLTLTYVLVLGLLAVPVARYFRPPPAGRQTGANGLGHLDGSSSVRGRLERAWNRLVTASQAPATGRTRTRTPGGTRSQSLTTGGTRTRSKMLYWTRNLVLGGNQRRTLGGNQRRTLGGNQRRTLGGTVRWILKERSARTSGRRPGGGHSPRRVRWLPDRLRFWD